MAKKTFEHGDKIQFKLLRSDPWCEGTYDQPDNKIGWHWVTDDQNRGYYVSSQRVKKS